MTSSRLPPLTDASRAAGQLGLRAAGLRARSPRARASRYALALSHGIVFPVVSTFTQRASAMRWNSSSSSACSTR
jgi:hypothetical protein